jgi:hypothetical protein
MKGMNTDGTTADFRIFGFQSEFICIYLSGLTHEYEKPHPQPLPKGEGESRSPLLSREGFGVGSVTTLLSA